MSRLACRICGKHDHSSNLIAPCLCAKRDDTLLCHAQCLLQHIQANLEHDTDTSEQEAATCPECGKRYQLKLRWRLQFTASKALSAFSLDQYCHLVGLVFMLGLLLLTAWFTLQPAHDRQNLNAAAVRSSAGDDLDEPAHPHQVMGGAADSATLQVWVATIVALVLVLSGVAIVQVLVRLRRYQTHAVLQSDTLV